MSKRTTSLRLLMHDWLGQVDDIHVSRAARSRKTPWCVVRIDVMRSSTKFAIVFFRHDDGTWCVYPPVPPCLRRVFIGCRLPASDRIFAACLAISLMSPNLSHATVTAHSLAAFTLVRPR
ncbi:hypothetical protein AWB81_06307 [Caballeronia arationis]|jgi:hypothetical protein|uniref:Uncharacterized protein n=1 Tax=Caballeronia arationis TaxID=1777142 RepID=A0A7Z7I1X5_9BURK|nr:hypothetical protein [Caballeronia arationis]SAL02969.1 hypothetical protein AWB81_06307 [Caballeronia arationis]SOE53925.1 hypothetical protein SAMN05446927_0735 [Caballeronia arationis]